MRKDERALQEKYGGNLAAQQLAATQCQSFSVADQVQCLEVSPPQASTGDGRESAEIRARHAQMEADFVQLNTTIAKERYDKVAHFERKMNAQTYQHEAQIRTYDEKELASAEDKVQVLANNEAKMKQEKSELQERHREICDKLQRRDRELDGRALQLTQAEDRLKLFGKQLSEKESEFSSQSQRVDHQLDAQKSKNSGHSQELVEQAQQNKKVLRDRGMSTMYKKREFIMKKMASSFGQDMVRLGEFKLVLKEFWDTWNVLVHDSTGRFVETMNHARFAAVCTKIMSTLDDVQRSIRSV
ncbi:hypothetical protein PHYPSEUDO_010949 [Phytophthora pseudosyringae]|uniref:Uncharacterized protein n=1 Tax=Phytophthora pseudosyringae TaxID=221518 RepID=A0A8T1VA11_9STRA|nr:hypothetical protein PHYPSEUDO_010944 [Phytophthora pseudosyringae]KAG7377811.1 hypothetical protein PHYPSEUDO_010949 [Phytophthora pseudosyringae]